MICKTCRGKIDDLSLYCPGCGEPSDNHKNQFILKDVLKQTDYIQPTPRIYFQVIGVAFAIVAVIFIFHFLPYWVKQPLSDWIYYVSLNLCLILLAPLLLLPFRPKDCTRNVLDIYGDLILFIFCLCLYFFAFKVICQGDPILNLVRFIMVLWGLAIAFPIPHLIFTSEDNTLLTIKKAYIAGKYLRWKQFYLCLYLGIRVALSIFTLFILLPSSLYYTAQVMSRWHRQQSKYNLYTQPLDY